MKHEESKLVKSQIGHCKKWRMTLPAYFQLDLILSMAINQVFCIDQSTVEIWTNKLLVVRLLIIIFGHCVTSNLVTLFDVNFFSHINITFSLHALSVEVLVCQNLTNRTIVYILWEVRLQSPRILPANINVDQWA